jgi:formyltetrahydrofolate deformylase
MSKKASKNHKKAVLLLVCPDRPGIVTHMTNFVFKLGGNILDSDQHTDLETGIFFMRLEWEYDRLLLARAALLKKVKELTARFQMRYGHFFKEDRERMTIMVSKYGHCLYDLLVRHQLGELEVEIPLIS